MFNFVECNFIGLHSKTESSDFARSRGYNAGRGWVLGRQLDDTRVTPEWIYGTVLSGGAIGLTEIDIIVLDQPEEEALVSPRQNRGRRYPL
jgi:hypothetical protein